MTTAIAKDVTVRLAKPDDMPLLENMYEKFTPIEAALGLPPADPQRRKQWLNTLTAGINLVAFCDEGLGGHLALMPGENTAEMAVFVDEHMRRHGVATALVNEAVSICKSKGLRGLWVLISSDNNAARNGLLNYGFHTAWESMGEVRMELVL